MEELNEETILSEFSKFVDIAPQVNLYVSQYIQNRIEIFKPIYQDFIELLQSTLHCKYFYLHKYEFIKYDKNNKPYFNNKKFKEKLNKIFSKTKLSEEEKEEKIDFYRQQLLNDTENFAMTDYNLIKHNLIITLDYNKNFILPEMTIFTELCYTFEKHKRKIIQPEYHFQNQHLQEIQQKSSELAISDEDISINIKTNVFAGLATLLNNIKLLENKPLLENKQDILYDIKYTILYLMSYQSIQNGFQAYRNLTQTFLFKKDNNIIKKCIITSETNQFVDYMELYNYIQANINCGYRPINCTDYKWIQSNIDIINPRKRPKNDTKIVFNETILGLTQDIKNKTISLERCKRRLEPIKTKISQNESAILAKLAMDLVEKCKTDVEKLSIFFAQN